MAGRVQDDFAAGAAVRAAQPVEATPERERHQFSRPWTLSVGLALRARRSAVDIDSHPFLAWSVPML